MGSVFLEQPGLSSVFAYEQTMKRDLSLPVLVFAGRFSQIVWRAIFAGNILVVQGHMHVRLRRKPFQFLRLL